MQQRGSKLIQDQQVFDFSSVFITVLQIFSPEVTLIHDQVWINVGAYD